MFEILHDKILEELNGSFFFLVEDAGIDLSDSLQQYFRLGTIVPLVHRTGN